MLKFINNRKGFTLIEIVVALGILVLLAGFTIISLSAIQQAKMREAAQLIKSEFELTRDFAKTHGGEATFSIAKVDGGLQIKRAGKNINDEEHFLKDRNLVLFYKETGDEEEYELGTEDSDSVVDATLKITFSQTQGQIIGPNMLDYIIISNGSKNFKFVINQSTGMIYYDYELEKDDIDQNIVDDSISRIQTPIFVKDGKPCETVSLKAIGSSVQPEINYDSRHVKISGEYRAVEPGTYAITFTLKDPYSTKWIDNTVDPKMLIWKIE